MKGMVKKVFEFFFWIMYPQVVQWFGSIDSWEPGEGATSGYMIKKNFKTFFNDPYLKIKQTLYKLRNYFTSSSDENECPNMGVD